MPVASVVVRMVGVLPMPVLSCFNRPRPPRKPQMTMRMSVLVPVDMTSMPVRYS
jgi:hypothetical protein